jgi:hypothetical protein
MRSAATRTSNSASPSTSCWTASTRLHRAGWSSAM